MRGIYGGYTQIKTDGKISYFTGGNTEGGFVGCYEDIANETRLVRVYIIKGGPGTGKSTLMRKIAAHAEKAGHSTEYYRCGSDPDSFDCVVIDRRIAILDGTAPHTWEMKYPGAVSEIIDVSKYLNKDKLGPLKNGIISSSALKTAEYAATYRYMRAAYIAESEMLENSRRLLDIPKAEKYVQRFVKKLGKARADGEITYRYTHALTMRGMWQLDTLERMGNIRYTVDDSISVAPHFMKILESALKKSGFTLTVGLIPLGGHISGIYIHDSDISITTCERVDGTKSIKMNRFVTDDIVGYKGKVRLAAKLREECLSDALSSLKRAAEHHFSLEAIYSSAMDFDALAGETECIINDILHRLGAEDKNA